MEILHINPPETDGETRPSGGGGGWCEGSCCGGDDPDAAAAACGGAADVGEDGSAPEAAEVEEAVAGGMAADSAVCLLWLWRSTVGECAVAFIWREKQI